MENRRGGQCRGKRPWDRKLCLSWEVINGYPSLLASIDDSTAGTLDRSRHPSINLDSGSSEPQAKMGINPGAISLAFPDTEPRTSKVQEVCMIPIAAPLQERF